DQATNVARAERSHVYVLSGVEPFRAAPGGNRRGNESQVAPSRDRISGLRAPRGRGRGLAALSRQSPKGLLIIRRGTPNSMTDDMDAVWKALSAPTRREILDLLRKGPQTTTKIVEEFPHLTRFGVMKHIDVLRAAGLINTREEGRQRMNSLNAVPIRRIYER